MGQNIIAQLGQAITQLLSTNGSVLQATGLDIFRGLATILIVWFGIKAALSASQGLGGFHFAKFADLILMIALGLGMLTYYSTPIPGTSYSFSDLITKEGLNLSSQIESSQTQSIADTITAQEQQLGSPPGSFNLIEDLTYLLIVVILALMEAAAFAVIAYGYVAAAVCVLIGPIFIPWFIVPKMDLAVLGLAESLHRLQLLSGRRQRLYLCLLQDAHFDVPDHRQYQHLERVYRPACVADYAVCLHLRAG
ncbi:MAG: hypothetical protein ABSA39_16425 [Edaphobacter sp.]